MGKVAIFAAVQSLLLLAAGCVRPPISDGTTDPPVHEVVRRLKCELALAIDAKRQEDPRFAFLTQWSAKAHLAMVVDDTAAFNPGATFVEPLGVAGTSRSLAVGGTLSTQAVRTEDIEFFLSFPEMLAEMSDRKTWVERYDYCRRDAGILLESQLGLKAVMDKALAPVGAGVLSTGKNNPGIGGGQPKIPAGEIGNIQVALRNLDRLRQLPKQPILIQEDLNETLAGQKIQGLDKFIRQFNLDKSENRPQSDEVARQAAEAQREKEQLEKNLAAARLLQSHARMLVRDVVNPLAEIAANSLAGSCQSTITAEKNAATASASVVAVNKYAVDSAQDSKNSNEALKKAADAEKETYGHAMAMLQAIKACGPKEKPQPALYDPIDLISETVNFYITYSGSITPAWKLVRVSAPLSSTLFSGTRKNTNTLILTLGRPSVSPDGSLTASRAMDNQILSQILSQAITVRTNQ